MSSGALDLLNKNLNSSKLHTVAVKITDVIIPHLNMADIIFMASLGSQRQGRPTPDLNGRAQPPFTARR
jgi:hypothetical protein